jgi:hypothetical protein
VSVTGMATDPANNIYASKFGGLTDLATFDCYRYNTGTGAVELDTSCGCGDYAVIVIKRNVDTHVDSNPNRNWFHGTIGSIDIDAGTATITLDDASNFDENSDHVVFFEKRDDSGLQSCQTDVYGWLGDEDGIVTDSGATEYRAIAWS